MTINNANVGATNFTSDRRASGYVSPTTVSIRKPTAKYHQCRADDNLTNTGNATLTITTVRSPAPIRVTSRNQDVWNNSRGRGKLHHQRDLHTDVSYRPQCVGFRNR